MKRFHCRMPQPIAANKVNHQQHQQRAANQHRRGNLQRDLQIALIGDFPDNLRAESADKLRREHVNADRSRVRPPRHHVVNHRRHRPVVPRHKKSRGKKSGQHGLFFFGLNRQQQERSREEQRHSDCDQSSVRKFLLQTVGNESAEQYAKNRRSEPDDRQRHRRFAQTELLVVDGEIDAPGQKRNSRKRDANSAANHRQKRRHGKDFRNRHNFRTRPARRFFDSKKRQCRNKSRNRDEEKRHRPAVARRNNSTENLAERAAQQHSRGENSLGGRAALLRKTAGNHGLRRGSVCRFAESDKRSRQQKQREVCGEAPGKSGHAPKQYSNGNDRFAAETVGEKSEGNAAKRENHEQKSLQRTQL